MNTPFAGSRRSPLATIKTRQYRVGLCAAVLAALAPFLWGADGPPTLKTEAYKGKVVPLATLLEKQSVRLDPDAAPSWLALEGEDGKVYPLVKDDGSRMFYVDPRLLDRPMLLTGRLLPDTRLLQVVVVQSFIKGELHDVSYWCDICSIRRYEKKICECCGGPMELREEPAQK
jgi:hypothetical protein